MPANMIGARTPRSFARRFSELISAQKEKEEEEDEEDFAKVVKGHVTVGKEQEENWAGKLFNGRGNSVIMNMSTWCTSQGCLISQDVLGEAGRHCDFENLQ